jgi:hypothetical protein
MRVTRYIYRISDCCSISGPIASTTGKFLRNEKTKIRNPTEEMLHMSPIHQTC